jgi:hypothetical protein
VAPYEADGEVMPAASGEQLMSVPQILPVLVVIGYYEGRAFVVLAFVVLAFVVLVVNKSKRLNFFQE